MSELKNEATGRLSVQTVERLHRLLGGDPHVEGMVLTYIKAHWDADSLLELPLHVARGIFKRPDKFLEAVKRYCEPELPI